MIREKPGQSQLLTEELMLGLVKAVCRQLFAYTSNQDARVNYSEKIYSIALKLDGDLLNLIVKWNNSSIPSTFMLKQLRFGWAPFKFIQALLKRPGETIPYCNPNREMTQMNDSIEIFFLQTMRQK